MSELRACILYTQDEGLQRRLGAYLRSMAELRFAARPVDLERFLKQAQPALAFIDLRGEKALELVHGIRGKWPATLIVALGTARSEPAREAELMGVYATEDVQCDGRQIQRLVDHALQTLDLIDQVEHLKQTAAMALSAPSPAAETAPSAAGAAFRATAGAAGRLGDLDALIEELAQGAAAAGAVRAGIFFRARGERAYRLRAQRHAPPEVRKLLFKEEHPFAMWLERHAQIVSRAGLRYVADPSERAMLARGLDDLYAEAVVPLFEAGCLAGWMFVGARATGAPYGPSDLQDLIAVGANISASIANARLYEEMSLQNKLLETLLHSMSTGVIMAESDGTVRWINRTASEILGVPGPQAVGYNIEVLGGYVNDCLRRTLDGETTAAPSPWTHPASKRTFTIRARPLVVEGRPMGAVALIRDVTLEQPEPPPAEADQPEDFWAELAASMSHEIRNPLVAIRTFSQLLPERYADADFRNEFGKLVEEEVARLDGVVNQISSFANPAELVFEPVDIRKTAQTALNLALVEHPQHGIKIEIHAADGLPDIRGDEAALTEGFRQVFLNAIEALRKTAEPRIELDIRLVPRGREDDIVVTIRDNGPGIPDKIRGKLFSPFCTTKARGMGLGLPVTRRTLLKHKGRIDVDGTDKGTCVTVMLPATKREVRDEALIDS